MNKTGDHRGMLSILSSVMQFRIYGVFLKVCFPFGVVSLHSDDIHCYTITHYRSGLTLEGDSGEEVTLWRLTSFSRWSKAKFKSHCNFEVALCRHPRIFSTCHLWKCWYRARVYWSLSVKYFGSDFLGK